MRLAEDRSNPLELHTRGEGGGSLLERGVHSMVLDESPASRTTSARQHRFCRGPHDLDYPRRVAAPRRRRLVCEASC